MDTRTDLALKAIRRKFKDWRSSRRNGEEIPAALWDDVHALESRFGRTNLAKALGLNSSDMAFQMNLRGAGDAITADAMSKLEAPAMLGAPRTLTASQTVAITKVVSVPFEAAGPLAGVVAEVASPSGWVLRLRSESAAGLLAAFIEATSRTGGRA